MLRRACIGPPDDVSRVASQPALGGSARSHSGSRPSRDGGDASAPRRVVDSRSRRRARDGDAVFVARPPRVRASRGRRGRRRGGRRANPLATRARAAAASSGDASANATSTDANGSTVDPPTSRYARTCADPGAKRPLEDVVGDPDDRRPRGDIRGVRWASSRVLALDAADPGWWTFPPPTPTGAWRTADWRARVPAHLHLPRAPQLLSVAPMMDYTTPHFRVLCRLLSRKTWLYTEMEVDQTLVHTDHPRLDRFLDFPLSTHPSVLQLGGSDPDAARARPPSPRPTATTRSISTADARLRKSRGKVRSARR